jgi:hypothetical protein
MTNWPLSRRQLLKHSSCGFGYLAWAALAAPTATQSSEPSARRRTPLEPKTPHFAPRAKRVIFLFMSGGPSQVDTFDPKPLLQQHDGQPIPATYWKGTSQPGNDRILLASPWKFKQHGQSGLWMSELYPHLARQADDLCVIRSMHCDSQDHSQACQQVHTGATTFVRASMGAWVLYGLGTENDSLPGFVTIGDLGRGGGPINRGSAFLPATFQGAAIGDAKGPAANTIPYLSNPSLSAPIQAQQLEALNQLNVGLLNRSNHDPQIEGVIQSFELAFRMQSVAPEVLDLTRETATTLKRYGIGNAATDR